MLVRHPKSGPDLVTVSNEVWSSLLAVEARSLGFPEAIVRFSRTRLVAGGICVDLFFPTTAADGHHNASTLIREDALAVRTVVVELDPAVGLGSRRTCGAFSEAPSIRWGVPMAWGIGIPAPLTF